MSYDKNSVLTRCTECNSVIYEDDSAESCAGECDREDNKDLSMLPLNFEDDGVLRELPDPEPMWPGFDSEDE